MSAEAPRDRKMEIFDICAVNLIPCDNSSKIASTVGKLLHKSPSSDPYVIFAIGGERVQTKEIKNTLNPKWEEHLTLKVPHNAKDMIVSVFDRDRFTSDDQMGVYQFKIPQANQSGTVDAPLTTIRGQKHATGNIKFTYNLVGVPDDGSMA